MKIPQSVFKMPGNRALRAAQMNPFSRTLSHALVIRSGPKILFHSHMYMYNKATRGIKEFSNSREALSFHSGVHTHVVPLVASQISLHWLQGGTVRGREVETNSDFCSGRDGEARQELPSLLAWLGLKEGKRTCLDDSTSWSM